MLDPPHDLVMEAVGVLTPIFRCEIEAQSAKWLSSGDRDRSPTWSAGSPPVLCELIGCLPDRGRGLSFFFYRHSVNCTYLEHTT